MTSEDLAARLRDWKNVWLQDSDQPDGSLYIEAADALAAAQEEIEQLREAVATAEAWVVDGGHVDDDDVRNGGTGARSVYEQLRAALGKEG